MEKMKLKRFLVPITLIIVTVIGTCTALPNSKTLDNSVAEYTGTYHILSNYNGEADSIHYNIIDYNKENVRKELVAEVNKYIIQQAPKAHNTISEHIVNNCLEHNIDICFVMSQTQNETNFGTTGAGRATSRRSLFGVYKRSYSNYKSAISDYFYILKDSYLVRGKTEQDLMRNYVTKGGYRYASDRNYEEKLRKTYALIKNSTNIHTLQKQYLSM